MGIRRGEEVLSPIVSVRAGVKTVTVELRRSGAAVRLAARGVWESGPVAPVAAILWSGRASGQRLELPRIGDNGRDRLFMKWSALGADGAAIGPAQWATDLSAMERFRHPIVWPREIKGVQCVVDIDDALALGAKHVGLNVPIRDLLLFPASAPAETVEIDGEAVRISSNALRGFDDQLRRFTAAGINVTPIVLNYFPRDAAPDDPLVHPRCDKKGAGNPLSAFNLTSEKSARLFRGLLVFLARRWSEPTAKNGRVSGFIIGNEVQSHWYWNNCGLSDPETVAREYADTLRYAWLAVRSVHPALRVYVSMDYYWTDLHASRDRTMPGRFLLERLVALGQAEGDYDWSVAHHPYPEGLVDPVFWDDEEAVFGYDTPIVTFKNVEVLIGWLNRPENRYRPPSGGPTVARRVILSEQGFNCRAETDDAETIQAAAYALAYHKVRQMDGIDAFILHRHVDHRDEGGLKLGLRAEDLSAPAHNTPGKKRRMYSVFAAAGTPAFESTAAFALPVAGYKSWADAAPSRRPIPAQGGGALDTLYPGDIIWDGVKQMWTATVSNQLDWRRTRGTIRSGGRAYGIFLHPRDKGVADAVFTVALPKVSAGKRLSLRFETLNAAPKPSPNGLLFVAAIDDQEIFRTVHTDAGVVTAHSIDLGSWTGKTVRLTLRTDARGAAANAWATFLAPAIVLD